MKTYAESKGEKPFDWNAFLNRTDQTRKEWTKAEDLAKLWVTCACGNQCDIIPRFEAGAPEDRELRLLGFYFYEAIESRNIERAKEMLEKIEKRSAELIKELTNEYLKPKFKKR